jgi:hypothetical protein
MPASALEKLAPEFSDLDVLYGEYFGNIGWIQFSGEVIQGLKVLTFMSDVNGHHHLCPVGDLYRRKAKIRMEFPNKLAIQSLF